MRVRISGFVRRIWLILLLAVTGAGIAAYSSITTYVPRYKSSVTMMVVSERDEHEPAAQQAYADILAGQQLVKEYKEIIKSRSLAKTVIKDLGLKGTRPEELIQNVSVSLVDETRILEVTVSDSSPESSAKLADCVGRVFMEKVLEVMKVQNIAVIDAAEVPAGPVEPQHKKNTAVGGFAGLLLGSLIVYLMEELDETIKTPGDVEKYLGIKVLGTIPRVRRK